MGPLSRDHDVRMELGIAPSTLRALIADGARAGIAPPFAGAERLRRWRGGPELWLEWVSEVQAWRASRKETAASGCDGEPAQASPVVSSEAHLQAVKALVTALYLYSPRDRGTRGCIFEALRALSPDVAELAGNDPRAACEAVKAFQERSQEGETP